MANKYFILTKGESLVRGIVNGLSALTRRQA